MDVIIVRCKKRYQFFYLFIKLKKTGWIQKNKIDSFRLDYKKQKINLQEVRMQGLASISKIWR